jgi:hypothetical protein
MTTDHINTVEDLTSSTTPEIYSLTRAQIEGLIRQATQLGVSQPASAPSAISAPTSGSTALLSSTCTASSPTWIIDSGASKHITGNSNLISFLKPSPNHPLVYIADGSSSPVVGIGSVQTTSLLPLHSVLYVPKCPLNLLSVSRLTKSLNCSVEFFPHHCVIQDLQTRKRIGGGREGADGLYYLELSHPITRAALSTSVTPEQWHFRLGHPSLHKLRKIVPFSQSSTFIHCESCQLGKHHKSI